MESQKKDEKITEGFGIIIVRNGDLHSDPSTVGRIPRLYKNLDSCKRGCTRHSGRPVKLKVTIITEWEEL